MLNTAIILLCAIPVVAVFVTFSAEHSTFLFALFHSLIYVAVAALSLKRSKWGYGIGICFAALWNAVAQIPGLGAMVDSAFKEWRGLLESGRIANPAGLAMPVTWLSHTLLIAVLIWAYYRLPKKRATDVLVLGGSLAVAALYFFAVVSYASSLPGSPIG